MTRSRPLVFWPVLLCAAAVVLAWSVYSELTAAPGGGGRSIYELLRPGQGPDARVAAVIPSPAPLPPTPPQAEFSLPAIESFTSVLVRPMFSTTRLPPVEEVVVVATPEPTLDVTLRGVILSEAGHIALIEPAAGPEMVRIKVNEQFEGWTLVTVETDHVVFRLEDEVLIFEVTYDESSPDLRPARPRRRQPGRQP